MSGIRATQDNAVAISNVYIQEEVEGKWLDNTPSIDYNLPIVPVRGGSTPTLLETGSSMSENDEVILINPDGSYNKANLGPLNSTETISSLDINDIFGDGSSIATYQMEDNVNDLGGAYNGTAHGISYKEGRFGRGLYSGGYNTYVTTGIPFVGTKRTYSMNFIVPSVFPHYRYMLGGVATDTYSNSGYGWFLNIYNGKVANGSGALINSETVELNVQHHFSISIDHSTGEYSWYLNGEYKGSATSSRFTFTGPANSINLAGFTNFSTTYSSSITIDQVRLIDRLATPEEHLLLYTESLVSHYLEINQAEVPIKAYKDKPVGVGTVIESTANRCIALDEILEFVSSTTSEYVGTNIISGLLQDGDSIQLDGSTSVVCSRVVEADLGDGSYQYTCTVSVQASAPTTAKVLDRSITTTEASVVYDDVNNKFVKTYDTIEQQGRAFKYKIEAGEGVKITKVAIPMSKQG